MTIKHYPGCTPLYPERDPNEPYPNILDLDLGDGGPKIRQCTDCGAFEVDGMPDEDDEEELARRRMSLRDGIRRGAT